MPKPWQPLNVLIAADEALAPARQGLIIGDLPAANIT